MKRSIFAYDNYRLFLKAYHVDKKESQIGWSYTVWARKLGLKSPSSLVMIIKGQRNPRPVLISAFVKYFQFDQKEATYFQNLILLEKQKMNPALHELLLEALKRAKSEASVRTLMQ